MIVFWGVPAGRPSFGRTPDERSAFSRASCKGGSHSRPGTRKTLSANSARETVSKPAAGCRLDTTACRGSDQVGNTRNPGAECTPRANAKSSSPRRKAFNRAAIGRSTSTTSKAGERSRNRSIPRSSRAASPPAVPIRTMVGAGSPATARTRSAAASVSRAESRTRRPASVSRTCRGDRSSNRTPNSRSNRATC